jgi:hypothetical protein
MAIRNIIPILDFQSVKLAGQYWLGVQHGMQQSNGPQTDQYLIETPTRCIMTVQFHPVVYYLGVVHGSLLDPQTCELRSQVSTLVRLTDAEVRRGYAAGRVWFFVDTATEQERRLTDMLVMQHLHELASQEYRHVDKHICISFSIGCLLGELSGSLFPWTVQEQECFEQESLQLLGYVEPLPRYALARHK